MEQQALSILTSQPEEFLSMEEAAVFSGKSASALRRNIRSRSPEFKSKYITKQIHSCKVSQQTRRMYLISLTGLKVMGFSGNLPTSNQNEKKDAQRPFVQKREAMIETALSVNLSPAQALLQAVQIIADLESKHANLENKVNLMETRQMQAIEQAIALPGATEEVPEMSTRDKVRQRVNAFCATTGKQAEVWGYLYSQLYYQCGFNAKARTKGTDKSQLDVIEEHGYMEKLFAIACKVLPLKKS